MTDAQLYKALRANRRKGESTNQQADRLGFPRSTVDKWYRHTPPLRIGSRRLLQQVLGLAQGAP